QQATPYSRPPPQPTRHFEAIEIGQSEIEDDQFWLMHGRLHETVLRRLSFQQPIAMGWQGGTQESTNLRFVFDDQNRRSRACHRHSSICYTPPDPVEFVIVARL